MLKIVLTGPESSGKSTLARALSKELGAHYVPEMARHYLDRNGSAYTEPDLLRVANLQYFEELRVYSDAAPNHLICDTDALTVAIWSQEKYASVDGSITDLLDADPRADLYLLCTPDIPWEPDPLRENPHDRDRLFAVYKAELESRRARFVVISGSSEERLSQALSAIRELSSD